MPSASTYNKIPRVPTGMPSELLRRRPDVIQAECNLHRATANVGIAVADLFPSVSLSGSASAGSGSDFAHFFSTAGWSLVGNVSHTIFNRTALNENVKMAEIAESSAGRLCRCGGLPHSLCPPHQPAASVRSLGTSQQEGCRALYEAV